MNTTQVPVTIPQDVTDYVATLGLQSAFEEFLERIPEMFPDLLRIECDIDPGIEDESDPVIRIGVPLPDRGPSYPTPHMRFSAWEITRFPGQILQHFVVLFWHEAVEDART